MIRPILYKAMEVWDKAVFYLPQVWDEARYESYCKVFCWLWSGIESWMVFCVWFYWMMNLSRAGMQMDKSLLDVRKQVKLELHLQIN